MARVFICVGHGGSDPGAVGNSLRESDINLNISLEIQRELIRHDVVVGMSRIIDENDPSSQEITEANAFKPDIAISVHTNAGGGDGFEAYYQTNVYKSRSLALAQALEAEVKAIGQNSRGLKTKLYNGLDYFGVLRQINAPCVLTECAFIDNSADVEIIDTLAKQQAFGRAYAKAALSYLGIAYKAIESTADVWYKVQLDAFRNKAYAEAQQKEAIARGFTRAQVVTVGA